MYLTTYNATALTVSLGRRAVRNPNLPDFPVIILDFPFCQAQELVIKILHPHARPEHVYAGYYRHADGKMTLGCYLLVPSPGRSGISILNIIGNEIDFKSDDWVVFKECLGEFGKFGVSCGIFTNIPNRSRLTDPIWVMECTTFYEENIVPLTHRAIFYR